MSNQTQKTGSILTRDLYRKIKNMTRDEMQGFINTVYKMGEDSVEGRTLDLDNLKAELSKVPGIGEKRLSIIIDIINRNIK